MKISESLLPEFDQEMAQTRRTLERVPADKMAWQPHEKSMTMGRLAMHLAEMHYWAESVLKMDSFDVAPPGQPPYQTPKADTPQEILKMFDAGVAATRTALTGISDADFMRPWTLLNGGKEIMKMPKAAVFRTFVMNHTIHHRAQLGVFLRLNNIPVPAIYGPSADESGGM